MSKIGEGKFQPPPSPDPKKDLEGSVQKFNQYLQDFKQAQGPQEKEVAKNRMTDTLSLMDLAAQQARKEAKVREEKLSKDFQTFKENPSSDNLDALEQDLNNLKDSL